MALNNKIDHPAHYKFGGIETIDYMKAKMTQEQFNGYLLGNIIKYTSRFQLKNGLEDLKKANWYLTRLIEESENDEESIDNSPNGNTHNSGDAPTQVCEVRGEYIIGPDGAFWSETSSGCGG